MSLHLQFRRNEQTNGILDEGSRDLYEYRKGLSISCRLQTFLLEICESIYALLEGEKLLFQRYYFVNGSTLYFR